MSRHLTTGPIFLNFKAYFVKNKKCLDSFFIKKKLED